MRKRESADSCTTILVGKMRSYGWFDHCSSEQRILKMAFLRPRN